MNNNIVLYIILLLFFTNISLGGTIDPKANDDKYIEYGSKHKCVVLIEGLNKEKEKYRASAVMINPRWAITAAHVVNDTSNIYVLYENKHINIILTKKPSKFDIDMFGKKDIALCYLEESIDLEFYPSLYDESDEIGKVSSQAGYGDTGTFETGSIKIDGIKRAGTNIIDSIEKDMLICSLLGKPYTTMEFLISHGDSGGGLFIDQKLAGIHSCIWSRTGSKPKATYSNFSGHTRVSIFKDWIESTIKNHK